jgi:hypothetical protein
VLESSKRETFAAVVAVRDDERCERSRIHVLARSR